MTNATIPYRRPRMPRPFLCLLFPATVLGFCFAAAVMASVELTGAAPIEISQSPSVNLRNGNLLYQSSDLRIPGKGYELEVLRSYNSRSLRSGLFGVGWTSNLDQRVVRYTTSRIEILEPDGAISRYFRAAQDEPGRYSSGASRAVSVTAGDTGFTRRLENDELEVYGTDGRLLVRRDRYRNELVFEYLDGVLRAVANNSGRRIELRSDGAGRVISIGDPIGRVWGYRYDDRGDLVVFVAPGAEEQVFSYDDEHNLVEIKYPDGASHGFRYDTERDLLSGIRDPGGAWTGFRYHLAEQEPGDLQATLVDPHANLTRYRFATLDSGRRLTVTDPAGGETRKMFDQMDNLVLLTDANGNTTRFDYDAENRLVARVDAAGNAWRYRYSACAACGSPIEITPPDESLRTFLDYDQHNELVAVRSGSARRIEFGYNEIGALAFSRDSAGDWSRYYHDGAGDLVRSVDSAGDITEYRRDAVGRLTGVVFPSGELASIAYDESNRPLQIDSPSFAARYEYDAMGRVVLAMDTDGATLFRYDEAGRLTEESAATGRVRRYAYDAGGRLARLREPPADPYVFRYDAAGRLASVEDPQQNYWSFHFDPAGNLIGKTDPEGASEHFAYDPTNRLSAYTDQAGNRLAMEFDWAGRLLRREDASGFWIAQEYQNGSLASRSDTAGRVHRFVYDADNRRILQIDGNLTLSEFFYGVRGEPLQRTRAGKEVVLAYEAGQLSAVQDPQFPIRYRYAAGPLLVEVAYPALRAVLSYGYDADGRRTSMRLPGGQQVDYAFDELGRLASIRTAQGHGAAYRYDATGRRVGVSLGNGVEIQYRYDPLGRLTGLDYRTEDGQPLIQFRQRLDTKGRVAESTSSLDGMARRYRYDPVGRLAEVRDANGGLQTFTYDTAGNRLHARLAGTEPTPVDVKYTYGFGHRLLASGETGARYAYDAEGNRIREVSAQGETLYAYTPGNRLLRVTLPDGSQVSYAYDFFERRVARRHGGEVEFYVYDNEDLVAVLDSDLQPKLQVLHGPGLDEPVLYRGREGVRYLVADPLGNIVAILDETGAIAQAFPGGAFGKPNAQALPPGPRYGFQGRRYDSATGLYYFRDRDFDPEVGRFLQPDPKPPRMNLNLYTLGDNDPVNFVDPFGTDARQQYLQARDKLQGTESYIRKLRGWRDSKDPALRKKYQQAGGAKELKRADAVWGKRNAAYQQARTAYKPSSLELSLGVSAATPWGYKYGMETRDLRRVMVTTQRGGGASVNLQGQVSWGESKESVETPLVKVWGLTVSTEVDPRTGKPSALGVQVGPGLDVSVGTDKKKDFAEFRWRDFEHTIKTTVKTARDMANPFRCIKRPRSRGRGR